MKHFKKLLTFSLALLIVFGLTGCGPQKQTGTTQTGTTQTGGKTVFDSIKDAMTKSLSLRCDYEANNVKSTVYIKGKSLRSETESKTGKAYAIVKDQKLWAWGDQNKQGILMDLSKQGGSDQAGGQKNQEDIIKEVEQYKQNCQQTVVSDSLFNPPTDIKFVDLSQMMQNLGGSVKP